MIHYFNCKTFDDNNNTDDTDDTDDFHDYIIVRMRMCKEEPFGEKNGLNCHDNNNK